MILRKHYEVILDDLIKFSTGKIDWTSSIGRHIYFNNGDIKIDFKIIENYSSKNKLKIEYNGNTYDIFATSLFNSRIGNIIGISPSEFKIEIGTRFKDNKRDIIITDREYRVRYKKDGTKCNDKYYKYTCNVCGWTEGWIIENSLLKGIGCSCCSNQKIIKGINDVATTHPHLTKYFVNIEDSYKYSYSSGKKVLLKCPDCGCENEMKLYSLQNRKFPCKKCSDGISYPNKFMFNILKQLNINFKTEYSPDWIEKRRYDFYIPSMNLIIEMDGGWHLNDNTISGQTAEESKAIDDYKDEQARLHGIEVIRVDCGYPNVETRFKYIKNNIFNNEKLNDLLNLSNIDWNKINESSISSLIKKAYEYKINNPNLNAQKIGELMGGYKKETIWRWLKQANNIFTNKSR